MKAAAGKGTAAGIGKMIGIYASLSIWRNISGFKRYDNLISLVIWL
jgi:hypothetical protein